MGAIRLDMSISLDGYVTGPDDDPDNPMGVGGFRLFNWLDHRDEDGPHGDAYAQMTASRAFISGRRTYELANHWNGDLHGGRPVFVLTHQIPDQPPPGSIRFSTDVHDCATAARQAAGDAVTTVLGAGAAQALLNAGQLDQLKLHVVPVLLGQGRRLFDHLHIDPVSLQLIRHVSTPEVEHLRYRVARSREEGGLRDAY
jgi:dihydrofolate reductase